MEVTKTDYDKYLDLSKLFQVNSEESWQYVEKRIYAIASGALALSITLLSTSHTETFCKWLIILSWILLCITIMINFFSHIVSYKSSRRLVEEIHKKMRSNASYDVEDLNKIRMQYNKPIMILNITPFFALFSGVICMIVFFSIYI
ncbi:MAG: hypothetical protein IKJ02_03945 [Tidjanibacter sp.]|nr:hypothetical protein [Tidjanibacter sp.]